MIRALRSIIHENYTAQEAWELFNSLKREKP